MKRVCLITGASGRLGKALCTSLRSNYEVIAAYNQNQPAISSQLRKCLQTPDDLGNVFCIQADLTKREDIHRLVEVALARFQRIDVLINAASDLRFHGRVTELWQADAYASPQLDINCVAPMLLSSAIFSGFWRDQREENQRWNRCIVNVSSMSGLYAYPEAGQAFYAASKAALNMLTLYQSLELAHYSVRVNAVCPGRFRSSVEIEPIVTKIRSLLLGDDTGLIS
jgi:NAD(P)-dependent dehydrogenase (short-subunit alcohol dehydrogenase family)